MWEYIGLAILLIIIIAFYFAMMDDREKFIINSRCQKIRDTKGNLIIGDFGDGSETIGSAPWLPYYSKVTECVPIKYNNVCRDDCSTESADNYADVMAESDDIAQYYSEYITTAHI